MWPTYLTIASTLFFWLFTAGCLSGRDWILVSGASLLNKSEKQKYKERNDVPAMNRFIGKTMMLPLAIYLTFACVMVLAGPAWGGRMVA